MKKIFLLGALALLCSTVISCTADEIEPDNQTVLKEKVKPADEKLPTYADDGPGDGSTPPTVPTVPTIPPKKD